MLKYLQSAFKWRRKVNVYSYARTIVNSIGTFCTHQAYINESIQKIPVCEWQQKMEQKSLDGSGFARLDIYELQCILNTNLVQYWLRTNELLTEKCFNLLDKVEFVPKWPEPSILSLNRPDFQKKVRIGQLNQIMTFLLHKNCLKN